MSKSTAFNLVGLLFTFLFIVALPTAGFFVHLALGWFLVAVVSFILARTAFEMADKNSDKNQVELKKVEEVEK